MSDEIFELRNENIELREMVRKLEAKNAELMENNDKLEGKNAELTEKNDKLEGEIESLKAGNSQLKNVPESNVAIQTSQAMEGSSNFATITDKPKRFFKNWLLFDTLPWIDRKELTNSSLSTASEAFRQLCYPKLHQNVKPHKIKYLKISAAHYELGNFRAQVHPIFQSDEIIPIASIPPLDYIMGIDKIQINFVNDEVVNFFKSIENLLHDCKFFEMTILNKKHISSSMRALMDCLANKIYYLFIGRQENQLHLNDFNKFFPGFIDNIQFIQFSDIPNIDQIDAILNWLATQSNDGKQKLIEFGRHDEKFMSIFSTRMKEEFSNSNSPSKFLI